MGVYIAGNSVVGSFIFVPTLMVLFVIGRALDKKDDPGDAEENSEAGCGGYFLCVVLQDLFKNPIIFMTIVGLLYKALLGFTLEDNGTMLSFPHPMSDALDLITAPFGMCALFLTGTTLKTLQVNKVVVALVIMKILVSPYLTYFFAYGLTDQTDLRTFAFLYGQLPTSSAPLIFAQTFTPALEGRLASAILMGLVLVGPLMYATALFVQDISTADMAGLIMLSHFTSAVVGCSFCLPFLILLCILGADWGWGCPLKTPLALYVITLAVYIVFMLAVSPQFSEVVCREYNEAGGRTLAAYCLCWLQNVGQLLVFGMLFLLRRYRNAPHEDKYDINSHSRREMPVILASLVLAIVPGILTVPSTVNEMCADVAPKLQGQSLIPNLVWTTVSLVLTLVFFTFAFKSTRSLSGGERQDEASSSETDLTQRMEHHDASPRDEAVREWQMRVPTNIIKQIFIVQTLKLLMQVVNTCQVWTGQELAGSVAETLILEHALVMLTPTIVVGVKLFLRIMTSPESGAPCQPMQLVRFE
eukprot:TRINITY_DN17767_c0_g1_i7.p1 TRINITY_DN17767_c0_g1~~TRINITY_DN17767_c0_g1_i7.p1  ORF type:complete len:529 (-),score=45.61 TRINITY_DN17767_c0_g1_i7:526-2112(-)